MRLSLHALLLAALAAWAVSLAVASEPSNGSARAARAHQAPADGLFQTAENCLACHNGLTTSGGEDVSFGSAWRASMMANSARDPYWQASVRREVMDYPAAAEHIEDECSVCHMPMARTRAVAGGRSGRVFAHLPIGEVDTHEARLAADGVSCTMCHQITDDRFGTPDSFSGGYVVDLSNRPEQRPLFGPFPVDAGRARIMHSATGFRPVESQHIRQSELCATCHTLYTTARDPQGKAIARFPEQVPYLEWRHSAFRDERSCQSCHMPLIEEPTPVAAVLGELRSGAARHDFVGANFFVLRMLNRYRSDLSVGALPQELDAAARATVQHLQASSATLAVTTSALEAGRLPIDVVVGNLTGHKLPTAYPSRRVWLHVTVRDAGGRILFESGAVTRTGLIQGNANDTDATIYEPHYREITSEDQVQIYESILADPDGAVTTGLLAAVRYLKDNRLLPRGFDKTTAHADIAVHGAAAGDENFGAGGDRVRYLVEVGSGEGPFRVEAVLRYQPIAFRWAMNLAAYDAPEPRRFVHYYETMATGSSQPLAHARTVH